MLREADFILPDRLEESIVAAPLGARIEVSGVVARKGEIAIRIDPERQVVAVHTLDPGMAVTEMELIESLLRDKEGVDSPSLALFYELLADVTVRASANPVESWRTGLGNEGFFQQVSQVMSEQVAPFGVRLAPAGRVPDGADWFDVRIEPRVLAPTQFHAISIVFRKHSREATFDFVRNLDGTLGQLVSLVEKGRGEE
jgi:hypothetical protein